MVYGCKSVRLYSGLPINPEERAILNPDRYSMTSRSKEQRILVVMRKLLAQIVRDTTPGPGVRHPLSEQTIKDIRDCFSLIAARERELIEEAGIENKDRPHFADKPQTSTVLKFKPPPKKSTDDD